MRGVRKAALAFAALLVGLGASFVLARWWSPICHEDCPGSLQIAMWLFLLALPIALAAGVALAAGRPRAGARLGQVLAALGVVGLVLTAAAVWIQGRAHGG